MVYLAVRGYWITRTLAEGYPALLREQLVHRQSHEALEGALAAGVGLDLTNFQTQIEDLVLSHFEGDS